MDAYERLIGGINAQAIKDYLTGLRVLDVCGRFTDPETAKNFHSAKLWLDAVRPSLTEKLDAVYTNNGIKKNSDLSDTF